jgi:hypothetical protein
MRIKMFQASGPDAAARLENEINNWLKSADDPDIEKIDTTTCQGRDGEVLIVVTILYEAD